MQKWHPCLFWKTGDIAEQQSTYMDSWRHKDNDSIILRGNIKTMYVMAFGSIITTEQDILDLLRIGGVDKL